MTIIDFKSSIYKSTRKTMLIYNISLLTLNNELNSKLLK